MPVIGRPQPTTLKAAQEEASKKKQETVMSTPVSPPASPSDLPPVRTPVRVRRTITRYAFEFFQDQLQQLKKFSLEEQLLGEKGSMSQMVREALDAYISKRKRTGD